MGASETSSRILAPINLHDQIFATVVEDIGFRVEEHHGLTVVFSGSTDALTGNYPQRKVGPFRIVPGITEAVHESLDGEPRLHVSGQSEVGLFIGTKRVNYESTIGNGADGIIQVFNCRIKGQVPGLSTMVQGVVTNPDLGRDIAGMFFNSLVLNGRVTKWSVGPNAEKVVVITAQIAA
jgi:hypothetical protein